MSREDVRNLLKEIIKTKDPDLIKLATEMLRSSQDEKSPDPKPQYGDSPPADSTTYSKGVDKDADNNFIFPIKQTKTNGEVGGVPVDKMPKTNKFVDTGEHRDEDNVTPSVTPTERQRPAFKKINQTCSRCGKSVETHPQFKRDFYVCDKCQKR
tara:strand:- start:6727 stop:7188 length:462 start_codon:yes stop_codon:yes gene_type:complete